MIISTLQTSSRQSHESTFVQRWGSPAAPSEIGWTSPRFLHSSCFTHRNQLKIIIFCLNFRGFGIDLRLIELFHDQISDFSLLVHLSKMPNVYILHIYNSGDAALDIFDVLDIAWRIGEGVGPLIYILILVEKESFDDPGISLVISKLLEPMLVLGLNCTLREFLVFFESRELRQLEIQMEVLHCFLCGLHPCTWV